MDNSLIQNLRTAFIPIAEPMIGKEEERLVLEGLRSGWVSSAGKYIQQFEEAFASFCNTKYGVTTSNGTNALHLALIAAGVGAGDEVIIPSLTFVATANTVSYTGAKPVFVDSELESWNIDPEKIKEKINRRTKAIIPVHLYGHPAKMGLILAIARKYGLMVIEDAAEAHGACYRGKKVGSLGDLSCFSFYGNKIITTGEGGMVVTNNKGLAERMKMLRDHGVSKRRRYYHPSLGFNYRMTNLQAALGMAQLSKIDLLIEKKRQIATWYNSLLRPLDSNLILQGEAVWAKNVYWMYSIVIPRKGKINRDLLIRELKKRKIDSRPFFFPVHQLSRYKDGEKYPVAEYLGGSGINLPSSVSLDQQTVKYICQNIISIFS